MSDAGGPKPLVSVLMGSKSDWPVMQKVVEILAELTIPHEARVFSAHRTPGPLAEYLAEAESNGVKVFIAGAGGAAHLAGVIASQTVLPVLGVPMQSKALQGLDSLLSTVQMPKGIPVATLAIGDAGAANAGLFAAQILGVTDEAIRAKLLALREQQAAKILAEKL